MVEKQHEIILYQMDDTNVCINVIYEDETFWLTQKAMAELPTMGLTTWKDAPDGKILKRDIMVAKNYLTEKELSKLNRLVYNPRNGAEINLIAFIRN